MGALRATIILATGLWAVAEVVRLVRPRATEPARLLWTAALILMWAHAAIAFGSAYGWSHQTAVLATARQTASVTGLDWGGGIYVNYLFLIAWALDALTWWTAPAARLARSPRFEQLRLAFFVFIFINGAIVFAAGVARAAGIVAVTAVCAAWAVHERRTLEHAR